MLWSLLVLAAFVLSCKGPRPPETVPDLPRGVLTLDFTSAGQAAEGAGEEVGHLSWDVDLSADRVGSGSALLLDGLWWSAGITVNGHSLGPVSGGPGRVEVAVGDRLREGVNRIEIELRPPSTEPALVTNGARPGPVLAEPPRLVLRPGDHLEGIALPLEDGKVEPLVLTGEVAEGCRVRAWTLLDGEWLQFLGSAPVTGGQARLDPVRWRGPRWRPGDDTGPGLVHALVLLESRDGEVLDAASWRVGVRDMGFSEAGLALDGAPWPLLAVRADEPEPPHEGLAELAAGGVNALEVHGEMPGDRWLAEADELGLSVVVLPRCDGRIARAVEGAGGPAQARALAQGWEDVLRTQDRRMAWAAARHPSILLWACEGDAPAAARSCEGISAADPVGTPVVGVDLPGVPLPLHDSPPGIDSSPGWVIEIASDGSGDAEHFSTVNEPFVRASGGKAIGGVYLPPPPREDQREEWRRVASGLSRELGATPLDLGDRRAGSRVDLRGLPAGGTAWIRAGWLTPTGVLADSRGRATLELWHVGPAEVVTGDRSAAVTLEADRWLGAARADHAASLDLAESPGP